MEKLLQLEIELPPPRPADMMRLLRGEPPQRAGSRAPAEDTSVGEAPAGDAPAWDAPADDVPKPSLGRRALSLIERAGWKTGLVIFFGMGALLNAVPDTDTTRPPAGS